MGQLGDQLRSWGGCLAFIVGFPLAGSVGGLAVAWPVAQALGGWGQLSISGEIIVMITAMVGAFGGLYVAARVLHRD